MPWKRSIIVVVTAATTTTTIITITIIIMIISVSYIKRLNSAVAVRCRHWSITPMRQQVVDLVA